MRGTRQTSHKRGSQVPKQGLYADTDVSSSRSTPSKRRKGASSKSPARAVDREAGNGFETEKTAPAKAVQEGIADVQSWISQLWDDSSPSCQVYDGCRVTENDLYGDSRETNELRCEWALRPWANAATMVQIALHDDTDHSSGQKSGAMWAGRVVRLSRMALSDKRLYWDPETAMTYMNALAECGVMLLTTSAIDTTDEMELPNLVKAIRDVINSFGLRHKYSRDVLPQVSSFFKKPFEEATNRLEDSSTSLEQCLCITGLLQARSFLHKNEKLQSGEWIQALRKTRFEFDQIVTAVHSFYYGRHGSPATDYAFQSTKSCCAIAGRMSEVDRQVFGTAFSQSVILVGEAFTIEYMRRLFQCLVKASIQSHFTAAQSSGLYILHSELYFSLLVTAAGFIEKLRHSRYVLQESETEKHDSMDQALHLISDIDHIISQVKEFMQLCPLPSELLAWIYSFKTFASLADTEQAALDRMTQLARHVFRYHFGNVKRASISEHLFRKTVCTDITARLVLQEAEDNTGPLPDVEDVRLLWSIWSQHTASRSAKPRKVSSINEKDDTLGSTPLFFTDVGGDPPLGATDEVAQNAHEALDELLQNTEDSAPEKQEVEVDSGSDESDGN
eukprot:gb/GECG01008617.1/.p1 GENE.gb/GECG01008617.1/~~gb/GECG01008617.1/.p1  ORF type:complete len:618 (+),score=70.89 gb/GECG01008617.1/:1-1854(+)